MSFATLKSCGTGLALAAIAALPIQALAQDAAPVEATSSAIVVRDATTGQLRAATADEARALLGPVSARRPGGRLDTLARVHHSGARGARLSDEQMSYSVLVAQPDGTLTEFCFASREEADAATKALSLAKTNSLPTE